MIQKRTLLTSAYAENNRPPTQRARSLALLSCGSSSPQSPLACRSSASCTLGPSSWSRALAVTYKLPNSKRKSTRVTSGKDLRSQILGWGDSPCIGECRAKSFPLPVSSGSTSHAGFVDICHQTIVDWQSFNVSCVPKALV